MALNANALTTLATVKDELGISGAGDDTFLERAINVASDRIVKFCDREFHYEASIEETSAGYGSPLLLVKKTPLLSIASVEYNDTAYDSAEYFIEDEGMGSIRRDGGVWTWTGLYRNWIVPHPVPGNERKRFTITYEGGYVTPQQKLDTPTLTRTLPDDLEDACVQLVAYRYRAKGRDPTIKSEKLLSASVSYHDNSKTSMPDSVQDILEPYSEAV